ncbi:MAG: iron-containing alcohol dehydrogenase [Burkholderiales bacterium]|nr:MAG: iron-containing alcohol dehydrogenase [Burkholderiales bacterium]
MITGAYRFPRQDAVIYGRPAHEAVIDLATRYNAKRLFILTTRSLASTAATKLASDLGPLCVGTFSAIASHSPRSDVIAGAIAARETKADLLVALGGGSVIDAAKLIQLCLWADLTSTSQLSPYRMGRGEDRKDVSLIPSGIRMVAIPTTLSAAEGDEKIGLCFAGGDRAGDDVAPG